jgi:NADPH:quinone reductase-like Zn-dependent oxidoreductase
MKAIVWTNYGPPDVLQLSEVEKPVPKDNEILIKIYATTVTAGDCEMRALKFPLYLSLPMRIYAGLSKPERIKVIGQELAGEIESVGKAVTRFKVGDQVFGSTGFGKGTYCEYLCLPEYPGEMDGVLGMKPVNMSYEEAAAVPVGGLEALYYLRIANIQSGHRILINGAGGSIGTIGVQLAKYYGAEVTAVDSTAKLEMLRSIGADQVIDYTKEDFARKGQTYDVIFDVVGKSPFSGSLRSLKPNGFYLIANPGLSLMVRKTFASLTGNQRIVVGGAKYSKDDLDFLKELVEAGVIKTVIDRRFPLEEMAEAHRYVEAGGKLGNVVITLRHQDI